MIQHMFTQFLQYSKPFIFSTGLTKHVVFGHIIQLCVFSIFQILSACFPHKLSSRYMTCLWNTPPPHVCNEHGYINFPIGWFMGFGYVHTLPNAVQYKSDLYYFIKTDTRNNHTIWKVVLLSG